MFYLSYAGYEMRKWLRDPLTGFLLVYPLMLAAVGRYIIPLAEKQAGVSFEAYYHFILVALGLLVSRVTGAIGAFSILDDRDDNVLLSVQVAPLSLEVFIGVKLVLLFVLSFVGTAFVLWFSQLADLSLGLIMAVSFVASFGGPLIALLINYVAQNKIEGFAALKGLGALVIFPVASLFFADIKEFVFAFEPGFWPAKALGTAILGEGAYQLSYASYLWAGLFYSIATTVLIYYAFKRKV